MTNCIYDDQTVVNLEVGPCAPVNMASGGQLVDVLTQETIVDVFTEAPMNYAPWILGALVLYFLWRS